MAGCDSGLTARADYIGLDAAKTVALEDAGVDASSATFSTAELDRRDGIEYYDLDFVSGGQEYEYDVNAITGQVISRQGAAADPAGTATAPRGRRAEHHHPDPDHRRADDYPLRRRADGHRRHHRRAG